MNYERGLMCKQPDGCFLTLVWWNIKHSLKATSILIENRLFTIAAMNFLSIIPITQLNTEFQIKIVLIIK